MKPIYPIFVPKHDILSGSWIEKPDFTQIVLHLKNVCDSYPSLLMAYSADSDMKILTEAIANQIADWGINVFMPEHPVPLAALSLALVGRAMPIGIYVEESQDDKICLIPVSSHGGLFDEQDLQTSSVTKKDKKGVIGNTELISGYVKELSAFADTFVEKGLSFSDLHIPFKEVEKALKNNKSLSILFEREATGPKCRINEDGCLLILEENGENIPTAEIAQRIARYLKEERYTSGAILGPAGKLKAFEPLGETIEIEGNEFDLSYSAGFSNLLLAWWHTGLISLQGSSCFGDAFLSAIYFLESFR